MVTKLHLVYIKLLGFSDDLRSLSDSRSIGVLIGLHCSLDGQRVRPFERFFGIR